MKRRPRRRCGLFAGLVIERRLPHDPVGGIIIDYN
jgi:hypothetical protein